MRKLHGMVAGLVLGLGFNFNLHAAPALLAQPPAQNDSLVSLVADVAGLQLLSPDQVPPTGTFWWVDASGISAPLPCPPSDSSGAIYQIASGQYLVDTTGGQVALPPQRLGMQVSAAAVVNARADALANQIDQIQADASQQTLATGQRMSAMSAGGIPSPGGGAGDGSGDYTPNGSSSIIYNPTNLWIAQTAVAAGNLTGIGTNTLADVQYEIQSRTNLAQSDWQSEGSISGSETTNWTPFSVAQNFRTNLFIRLQSWASSDGSGLPDWWEQQYFGTNGVDPYGNPKGDGYDNFYKAEYGMNPFVFYTPAAPQNFTVSYSANNSTATLTWLPAPGNVNGYTIERDYLNHSLGIYSPQISYLSPAAGALTYSDNVSSLTADPTSPQYGNINVTYRIEANYGGGNSVWSAKVPMEAPAFAGSISGGSQGSVVLTVAAMPANTTALRLTEINPYADYPNYANAYITNFTVAVSSASNFTYVLPDTETGNGTASLFWEGQAIGSDGSLTANAYLGGTFQVPGNETNNWMEPAFYDGRTQLKQNLIFQLRAAAEDAPLHFSIPMTNIYSADYGDLGEFVGDYLYPTNYAYAGLYQLANLNGPNYDVFDPLLPFEENCLFRNFVAVQADLNENGGLSTGLSDNASMLDSPGYDYVTLARPLTYHFQINDPSFQAMLATNATRWLFYDQSDDWDGLDSVDFITFNWNAGSVTLNNNYRNWFGLPYVSAQMAYTHLDDQGNSLGLATSVVPVGGTFTFSGDDVYDLFGRGGYAIYPETAQPQLQTVAYYFCNPNPFFNAASQAWTPAPLPGYPTFSPTNQSQLLITGVGSQIQIAGYAKLAVANSVYSGVYGYLGQYFDHAYAVDASGNVTTNTTGVLSPYGNFLPTEPGPVAVVTMPDIDPPYQRGTCTVYSVSLVLDKNHDLKMDGSFNGPDATSQASPMVWWINDDYDYSGASWNLGQDLQSGWYYNDGYQQKIDSQRDLEDYARLWICGMPALTNGNYQVTLSWANVSSGSPTINLFDTVETNGGIGYLTNLDTATAEAYNYGIWGENRSAIAQISPSQPFTFPASYFINAGDKHFLFDGAITNGAGELMLTIADGNGNTIAQTGAWLDLHDVKDFYERAVITNNISSSAISNWTSGVEIVQQATASALGDDTNLIVLVHGFNVANADWLIESDTVFKRLYWAGYRGKFASVDWPCGKVSLNPYAFNTSEVNAYKASASLKIYLDQLHTRFSGYRLNILAHSQGNAVVSEAIKQGAPFDTYILTQGAIPASCFDVNAPIDSNIASHDTGSNITPEWQQMGYHGIYTNLTGRIVNFYNEEDFALVTGTTLFGLFPVNWIQNQKLDKPSLFYSYDGTHSIYMSLISSYLVTDTQECRANVSRSRTDAVGSTAGLGGAIQNSIDLHAQFGFSDLLDEHSAQWTRPIQTSLPYYQQILIQIQPAP
jgi:hypothetical protein